MHLGETEVQNQPDGQTSKYFLVLTKQLERF